MMSPTGSKTYSSAHLNLGELGDVNSNSNHSSIEAVILAVLLVSPASFRDPREVWRCAL